MIKNDIGVGVKKILVTGGAGYIGSFTTKAETSNIVSGKGVYNV